MTAVRRARYDMCKSVEEISYMSGLSVSTIYRAERGVAHSPTLEIFYMKNKELLSPKVQEALYAEAH